EYKSFASFLRVIEELSDQMPNQDAAWRDALFALYGRVTSDRAIDHIVSPTRHQEFVRAAQTAHSQLDSLYLTLEPNGARLLPAIYFARNTPQDLINDELQVRIPNARLAKEGM